MIAGPRYFAALAARLRWDAETLDLTADAESWSALDPARRSRLTVLLAGFCIAESRVADELAPFEPAAKDPAMAVVFAAQRADERRHYRLFDRIAALVLGAPPGDPGSRRRFVRALVPPPLLDLFERRLPETASALSGGRAELVDAVALYHLILEGVVLTAGQHALLAELGDGALPGVRRGVELVERDERWHVGFGLRCMLARDPGSASVLTLLEEGQAAIGAWGPAVSAEIRSRVLAQHRRRLAAIGLIPEARAHATVGRSG
ncbi:MAG: ribonucleotide-diphosphate reductase subunit beta [Solirubrobacterales bacterium]|nr:ribonucleotide-diphosphate reductase subunit beta [Solirubrobacterales bacterium]